MRRFAAVFVLLLLAGASGAYIYISTKANLEIFTSDLDVSPQSFSVSIAKGGYYIKQITVKNTGSEKEIYFEEVVEGPRGDAVDVTYHTTEGEKISSTKKLRIPAGTDDAPSEIRINVHIDVDDDAPEGEYTIYIYARS